MSTIPPSSSATTTEETDQKTLTLIRRVLCSHSPPTVPLEELLPALSSSPEVDAQLYAFVAVIARDFILSWYSRISDDHVFIDEIIALIAHCTRSLEERLRKIDAEALLLDEVPAILDAHVKDYRRAVERHGTALAAHMSLLDIFRNYQPHPALANPPESERVYMKLLANGILAVLLPTEDLENDCERSLLREILSSLVLGNILDNLSEPFMIYEILTKLSHLSRLQEEHIKNTPLPLLDGTRKPPTKPTNQELRSTASPTPPPPPLSTFERTFNVLTKTVNTVFSVLASIHHLLLNPLPVRSPKRKTLVRTAFPSFVSTFLNLQRLQPWLPATLRLISKPFSSRTTTLGILLDDFLISKITPFLSSPKTVVQILKLARANLFPGDALAPPRQHPTEERKAQIRAEAEKALLETIPEMVRGMWWRGPDKGEMAQELGRNSLDVFSEKEINKVLLVRLIDLLAGRLFPELLEHGGDAIKRQRTGLDLELAIEKGAAS